MNDELIINDGIGSDILTTTPYNGEEIRRAYNTIPWLRDNEIYGFSANSEGGKEEQTHNYVDLGLSSGTLWATCNIGANSPEEAGMYFAWGGTSGYTVEQVGNEKGKRAFTWEDYEYGNPDSGTLRSDIVDGNNNLLPEYDAATANWGDGWRMPTKAEFEELMELPHTWDSSRSGYSFTDGNDNELLFVFAGGCADDGNVYNLGENGYCWSGSLYDDDDMNAWVLNFYSVGYEIGYGDRYMGHTVRPVKNK